MRSMAWKRRLAIWLLLGFTILGLVVGAVAAKKNGLHSAVRLLVALAAWPRPGRAVRMDVLAGSTSIPERVGRAGPGKSRFLDRVALGRTRGRPGRMAGVERDCLPGPPLNARRIGAGNRNLRCPEPFQKYSRRDREDRETKRGREEAGSRPR